MTTPAKKSCGEHLDNLLDAELKAILEASDEDILAEATETHTDITTLRTNIIVAVTEGGKRRLDEAKKIVESSVSNNGMVIEWPLTKKRELIEQLRNNKSGLTLAARHGEDETENDLNSLIEDLIDIGAIDDEGNVL